MGKPIIETLRELSEKFSEEGEWTHGAAIDETCGVLGIKQNPWWAVDYSQILAFIADEIEAGYVSKEELEPLRRDISNHWSASISVEDSFKINDYAHRLTAMMEG